MHVPIITESRCRVCRHPNRVWIERMIMAGYPHTTIANHVRPNADGKRVARRSITRHYNKHMLPTIARIEFRIEFDELLARLASRPEN